MMRSRFSAPAFALVLLTGCRPPGDASSPEARPEKPRVEASGAPAAPEHETPEGEWTPVASEEGIEVSSRPSPTSPQPVFRGVGIVEAPLVDVLAVVTDAEHHHQWVFSCSASALISQTSESSGIVYNRTATPWPVPDRDVVLDSRVEVIDGEREVLVRFSATDHPDRPPEEGVVRMVYLEGQYHLWAEGEGSTRVEYRVDSDPGGRLPTWLATRGTRDMPLETLRALRVQVVRTRGSYDETITEFRRTLFQAPL